MHRNDRLGPARDRRLHQHPGRGLLNGCTVSTSTGVAPRQCDGVHRGVNVLAGRDHLVAGADAQGAQRQVQRVGARRHAHGSGAAPQYSANSRFELRHGVAQHEGRAGHHLPRAPRVSPAAAPGTAPSGPQNSLAWGVFRFCWRAAPRPPVNPRRQVLSRGCRPRALRPRCPRQRLSNPRQKSRGGCCNVWTI